MLLSWHFYDGGLAKEASMSNIHYHRRAAMRERLRERLRDSLEILIDPEGLYGIYHLFREWGIVDSKLDFAHKTGVNRETIRTLLSKEHDVGASLGTIRKISEFVLPYLMNDIYPDYSIEELARTLLPDTGSPRQRARLQREVVKAVKSL
jgi:hypothetical protein